MSVTADSGGRMVPADDVPAGRRAGEDAGEDKAPDAGALPVGRAGAPPSPMPAPIPARAQRERSGGDAAFALLARAAGLLVLLILGAIIISLLVGGWPAFAKFGAAFLTTATWDPVRGVFGGAVPILGTLLTSVLALVLALPLSFGIAFYLTELSPAWLSRPVGVAVELLAGIPSIIYGMWGLFVIAPVVGQVIEPAVDAAVADIPVLGTVLMQGPGSGKSLFTAALVLAVMIVPFIAATMRDVFLTVPPMFKESAYGLGCTTWEVMRSVVLPYTRASVVGGVMLGLGRALGETMAVTFVIGSNHHLTSSIFEGGDTIASIIALEFGEAAADPARRAPLLALGFLLFVISFAVLAVSRLLLRPRVQA